MTNPPRLCKHPLQDGDRLVMLCNAPAASLVQKEPTDGLVLHSLLAMGDSERSQRNVGGLVAVEDGDWEVRKQLTAPGKVSREF